MKEFKYTIKDPVGLHARPAGMLVKLAAPFKSTITIDTGVKQADAKRIMAVMSAGAKQGVTITCRIEGEDENEAYTALKAFFEENL